MIEGAGVEMDGRKRQIESRKRKHLITCISLSAKMIVLAAIVFFIRNIYTHLEEMQMELERLKIQQYGTVQTSADAQTPDKVNDADYVGSLSTWEVGGPTERTEAEVIQRLGELGQTSSLIGEICQSHSQYPKELLAALANNPEMAEFVSGYPGNGVTDIINRFNDLMPDGNYNRLGTTFETAKLKYFFDTGTGKVFECSEDEYTVLSHLFECNELIFKDDTHPPHSRPARLTRRSIARTQPI